MRVRLTIVIAAVLTVWIAPGATAQGSGCVGGTVHRFTLPRGVTHWGFEVPVPSTGSLHVELRFSRISSRNAHFRITVRRRSWRNRVLMIDSTRARQCSGHRKWRTCMATRPHTRAGVYFITTWKLTAARAKVRIVPSWPCAMRASTGR
jgi:hypothetical protein